MVKYNPDYSYEDGRTKLADAIIKSANVSPVPISTDQLEDVLANAEYDGRNNQSLKVAFINIYADRALRCYGLHSIEIILNCICDLYEPLELHHTSGFELTHYGHVLVFVKNVSPWALKNHYLVVDIADLIDETHNVDTGSSIAEIVDHVKSDRHGPICFGEESDFFHNLSPSVDNGKGICDIDMDLAEPCEAKPSKSCGLLPSSANLIMVISLFVIGILLGAISKENK